MIDLTSAVRLRNGGKVRLLKLYQGGTYPIEGEARLRDLWESCRWTRDGKFCLGDPELNPWDLIEVKP